jgi:hypothetical protein
MKLVTCKEPTVVRRVRFEDVVAEGPVCDEPTLTREKSSTSLQCAVSEDEEYISWLDSLPCPEAPPSPVVSKKRVSMGDDGSSHMEPRCVKVGKFEDDEVELLDPSTGPESVAEYDLVDGRFVEVFKPYVNFYSSGRCHSLPSTEDYPNDRERMGIRFDSIFNDYDGWGSFMEDMLVHHKDN